VGVEVGWRVGAFVGTGVCPFTGAPVGVLVTTTGERVGDLPSKAGWQKLQLNGHASLVILPPLQNLQ